MCYYYPDAAKLGGAIMAGVYFCSIGMLLVAGLSITDMDLRVSFCI
jgi:hypothetical protein